MSDDHTPPGETFALPAGTVTFLLSDIAGSTRNWEDDPQAMAKAVSRHYDLIGDAVGRHGGVRPLEQGEGDSVVGAFARASDALAAAVDVQIAFGAEPWPAGARPSTAARGCAPSLTAGKWWSRAPSTTW